MSIRNFFPLMDAAPAAGGGAAAAPAAGAAPLAAGAAAGTPPATPAAGAAAPAAVVPVVPPGHWGADWLKPDGTVNGAAFDRAPEHLRGLRDGELKNAKTLEDVMTKMTHLATLAGKKGLAPLPADAKPEVVAERNALLRSINGVPDKPEDYGIAKPADLPDAAWNEDAAKSFTAIAHKWNIPPGAVKEIVGEQAKLAVGQLAAQANYEKEFFEGQERDFKTALEKEGTPYDKAMDLATRTAKTFGLDPESPMFKNAQVRLMLKNIGVAIGEPRLVTGGAGDQAAAGDRAKAEAIIHDKTNPEYAIYHDGTHPQNRVVKEKVWQWMASAVTAERAAAQAGAAKR